MRLKRFPNLYHKTALEPLKAFLLKELDLGQLELM